MTYGDYPDLTNVKNILVIKLRHLGDVLLTGPVFTTLKKFLPQAAIDAYVYEEAKPMLEGHPTLRALIGYDRGWKKLGIVRRLWKEWEVLQKIRRGGYDLVINLTEGERGAIAAKMTRATLRVGFDPKKKWQKNLYTHGVKHCPGLRHTVERNLDALRRIGIFPDTSDRDLFLHVPPDAVQKMRQVVGEGFVLIHPTSRWRFKCWPVPNMRELVRRLLDQGKKIAITSGPDQIERAMAEEIAQGFDVQLMAGQISLKELAALIELSECLVCVDSVPLHMASALKKSVVAIFGPTSEVTWGPWRNPKAQIIAQNLPCRPCYLDGCGGSKYSDCLHTLPVDKVLRAITAETLPQNRFCGLAGS